MVADLGQGVGWVFDARFPGPVPAILTVSNAMREVGKWEPAAGDVFVSDHQLCDRLPNGFDLRSVGQELSQSEQAAIWRLIRRSARRSAPPGAFLRSLLLSMRWLANRHPTIGHSFMALSIPKRAAEDYVKSGRMVALMTGPLEKFASFLCFGPDGRAQQYGPHAAMRGVSITDFTVTPIPPKPPGG